jgi:hypothetical protein
VDCVTLAWENAALLFVPVESAFFCFWPVSSWMLGGPRVSIMYDICPPVIGNVRPPRS